MATVKKPKKQTFEEAIAELEATVAKLEQDDITLDESIGLFTRGVELTGLCNNILNEIEGRIVKLVENPNNEGISGPNKNASNGNNKGAGGEGDESALIEAPFAPFETQIE